MILEPGRYYQHEGGRYISIVAEAITTAFGRVYLCEEADKTGHAMSIMEVPDGEVAEVGNEWTEVGEAEWDIQSRGLRCEECKYKFNPGIDKSQPVLTPDGFYFHSECLSARIRRMLLASNSMTSLPSASDAGIRDESVNKKII